MICLGNSGWDARTPPVVPCERELLHSEQVASPEDIVVGRKYRSFHLDGTGTLNPGPCLEVKAIDCYPLCKPNMAVQWDGEERVRPYPFASFGIVKYADGTWDKHNVLVPV